MKFAIKILITICVIIFCTQIGRRWPSLAGLIATMPLAGLIVLLWLYSDNPGNFKLMADFTKGAIFGIIPTIFFFLVAFICFRKQLNIRIVLTASFVVWLIAAAVHQLLLHK
jgi:uncharacterized membrane protein (GlpM family)